MARSRSPYLALLAASILAAPLAAGAAERRAVVIGIDRYVKGARWQNLTGATNDARAMGDLLREVYGFQVSLLLDEAATRQAILDAVGGRLVDGAAPGQEVVLYFAGHGSQVRNSLSPEADRRDETIVPHDGRDIRDYELGALLVQAARAGARVTALFDSCHSGGVTRGLRGRSALPDETDHPVAVQRPDPAAAGVVTVTAAQAEQLAYETLFHGREHGRFTSSLLFALGAAPAGERAEELFARVHARLRAGGDRQDPTWSGPLARRREPLLGAGGPPGAEGSPAVAVAGLRDDGVELHGGPATGLTVGSVLARRAGAKPPLRLTVRAELGPTRSLAGPTGDGDLKTVAPGDLLEVERLAPASSDRLAIDLGPSLPAAEVLRLAKGLAPLAGSSTVRWIHDPALAAADWQVELRAEGWVVTGPGGARERLPSPPDAAAVEGAVKRLVRRAARPVGGGVPSLFVRLPVARELADELAWSGGPTDEVAPAPPATARYALVGRAGPAGPEYAAVLLGSEGGRGGAALACSTGGQLPARTRWAGGAAAASTLRADVAQLVRIQGWLDRAPSPGEAVFPYRLELREGGRAVSSARQPGAAAPGATLELWLVADPERLQGYRGRRYVHVIALDCRGAIDVAVPLGEPASAFPPEDAAARARPEHRLGEATLDQVAGAYTFILIASADPISDPGQLELGALRGPDRAGGPPERWWLERVPLQAR